MNCKQVENLLPLYVGRDLEAGSERLVTAHVESCTACSAAAAEYRQTRELLQDFAPPSFSADVYAGIRQNVRRRIESESSAQSLSQVIAGWFQPRLVWAAAASLLIAASVLGLYLFANRGTSSQQTAGNPPPTNSRPGGTQTASGLQSTKLAGPPSAPSEGWKRRRQADIRRAERKSDRLVAPDRPETLAANAPDALPNTSGSPSLGTSSDPDPSPARDSVKTLRMEIQTKDPNIRIIWFAQRDTKPVSHNSKGT